MNTAWLCLTMAMYFEAATEGYQGMMAVGTNIMTRVESAQYPNTVCGVVKQRRQYSFYWDGKPEKQDNSDAWWMAGNVANAVLEGARYTGLNGNPTHYVNLKISKPDWVHRVKYIGKVGDHWFFEE